MEKQVSITEMPGQVRDGLQRLFTTRMSRERIQKIAIRALSAVLVIVIGTCLSLDLWQATHLQGLTEREYGCSQYSGRTDDCTLYDAAMQRMEKMQQQDSGNGQ